MTLFQFYQKFNTEQKCCDYLVSIRWPDGIKCPHCGHDRYYKTNGLSRANGSKVQKDIPFIQYKCANNKCYKKFTVKTNTVFHACNIPLWQFFYLIFSSCTSKKNISSVQQSINLGITQKSSWYIMDRIRMVCYQDDSLKLWDEVEVDETYLAAGKWGRWDIYRKGRKIPVLGLLQRGGKVIIKVMPNKNKKTVQDIILKHVECGTRLLTDSASCYFNMESYYIHETINHRSGEYVRGDVYTNGIENVWSHFKKAIIGTHQSVSIVHLQRYCDEFAYRWNNKEKTPIEKFNDLLKRACNGKPIGNKKSNLQRNKHTGKSSKKYTAEVFSSIPTFKSNIL